MSIRLPTIDYRAVQNLLATDRSITADDVEKLDSKTQGMAAIRLLEGRKATNPSDSDKLQMEIDAINAGQMPATGVQAILDSASNDELRNALFLTGYGITAAQFAQMTAGDTISDEDLGKLAGIRDETVQQTRNRLLRIKLGEQYGFTPKEIDDLLKTRGAGRQEMLKKLGKAIDSEAIQDSLVAVSSNSTAKFTFEIGPLVTAMAIAEFITAIVAAIVAILRGKTKTQQVDAEIAKMRMDDVAKVAHDRIETIQKQSEAQVSNLKMAIKQIGEMKLLQKTAMIAAYVVAIVIVIASVVAAIVTFGALSAAVLVAVVVAVAIITATTVFFTLQMKDLERGDGKTWAQRASEDRYGNESKARSAKEAQEIRAKRQRFESFLNSIQTIIDVITAILSFGTSSVGTVARETVQQVSKTIMQQIGRVIQRIVDDLIKNLVKMLVAMLRAVGFALMISSAAVGAMSQSGQLQDLMSRNSDAMRAYRDNYGVKGVDKSVATLKDNADFKDMSESDIRAYAAKEQELILNGDQKGLAELYARREAASYGMTKGIDLTDLSSGKTLSTLSEAQQTEMNNYAAGDIQQSVVGSVTGYQNAISEYTQKNQGLLMGIQIGAAVGGMVGGGVAFGGGVSSGAQGVSKESAKQTSKVASKIAQGTAEQLGETAGETAESAAKSAATAADAAAKRAQRVQSVNKFVQVSVALIQPLAQSAANIHQSLTDIELTKKRLKLNELKRHYELMLALQDLAVDITNRLKEEMFDVQSGNLTTSKAISSAIESIWKGLDASFDAAIGSKQ